jgi:hypothetical protein
VGVWLNFEIYSFETSDILNLKNFTFKQGLVLIEAKK